jgi:hypothetical protein
MTRSDVFMKILSEIIMEHKAEVQELVDMFKAQMPDVDRLDRDLSPADAEQLFTGLREDKDNIRVWLLQGRNQFISRARKSHRTT